MYRIILSDQARKEYLFFSQSGNKIILNKITALLNDIAEHPYTGIGKPEPLKYELTVNGQGESPQNIVLFTL